jgi:hypothetical protein
MAVDNRTPLSAFNGSLTLEGGEIDARLPVPVAVTGGNTYSNEAMMLYHATAAAGKAVKTGSGELVVSGVPADVTLEVREGLLNIAQPLAAEFPTEMRGALPNRLSRVWLQTGRSTRCRQRDRRGMDRV